MRLAEATFLTILGLAGCSADHRQSAVPSSSFLQQQNSSVSAGPMPDATSDSTTSDATVDLPQTPCADGAVGVAVAYVEAVQAGEAARALRCQVTGGGPTSDRMAELRDWGVLLIDHAEIADQYASGTVTVRIPSPPTPNIGEGGGTTVRMADHQTGVIITLVADPRPNYFVTDVSFYASE